jgi:nucleoside-diphosphate-sugar epimerase
LLDLASDDLNARLPIANVHAVVHLAARISGTADEIYRDNVLATHALLQAISPALLQHLVLISSVSVYGDLRGPQSLSLSEDEMLAPADDYAQSKATQETLFENFARGRCTATVLRPSSIYGADSPHLTVLPAFVDAAQRNTPLRIHAPRGYRQNFVHVGDLVRAVGATLEAKLDGCFNLFGPDTVTMSDLAHLIVELFDSSSLVIDESTEPPAGARNFANQRLANALGLDPTPLREGLQEFAHG